MTTTDDDERHQRISAAMIRHGYTDRGDGVFIRRTNNDNKEQHQ